MEDLILYLGITVLGYIIGSKARAHGSRLSWTGRVQTVAITVLVLTMGLRMGANEEITKNLSTIGVAAFCMTVTTMVGAVVSVVIARKLMGIDRYGRLNRKAAVRGAHGAADGAGAQGANAADEGSAANAGRAAGGSPAEAAEEGRSRGLISPMTVLIVVSVAAGIAIGYFAVRKLFAGNMEAFDSAAGLAIKIGLCVLLLFVGTDLGLDGTVVRNFRTVGLRILVFPFVSGIGTLIGAAAVFPFIGLTMRECLAVGAGFSWYTLAPGIIMEAGHLTAGAVAFLHNVMREFFSILLIPTVAAKIGYVESTSLAGAAAMDICLPIVERTTRSDIAVYSFVSGVVLSILVPVLVPVIIG